MVKERKASGKVVGPSEGHSQTPCLPKKPALSTTRATSRVALSWRTHWPAVAAAAYANVNPASE